MNLQAPLSMTALVIFLIISVILPLVSSFMVSHKISTKYPEVAGLITIVLSVLNGTVTEYLDHRDNFNWHVALSAAFVSLIIAFQTRARVWLGSRSDEKALAVGSGPSRGDAGYATSSLLIAVVIILVALALGLFAHPLFFLLLVLLLVLLFI